MKNPPQLLRHLPFPIQVLIKRLYHGPQDLWNRISGNYDPEVPPKRLQFVGRGDFKQIGAKFLALCKSLAQLKETDVILDMGCGVGRMALPISKFLTPEARYEGFDVVREGIMWCNKHISSASPNFRFTWLDIYNKSYNPHGKLLAADLVFPYPDRLFDFTFATSLFTHMFLSDVRHYISESARVLKPGGRCFFTFFLINPETQKALDELNLELQFLPLQKHEWTIDPTEPERAMAFEEDQIAQMLEEQGFENIHVYYGTWRKKPGTSYQDIIVANKKLPDDVKLS